MDRVIVKCMFGCQISLLDIADHMVGCERKHANLVTCFMCKTQKVKREEMMQGEDDYLRILEENKLLKNQTAQYERLLEETKQSFRKLEAEYINQINELKSQLSKTVYKSQIKSDIMRPYMTTEEEHFIKSIAYFLKDLVTWNFLSFIKQLYMASLSVIFIKSRWL